MSKELKLSITPKERSIADFFNDGHVGVEFYVHNPRSTAPMMYDIYSDRDEADEAAARIPDATVLVRDVSEWRVAR